MNNTEELFRKYCCPVELKYKQGFLSLTFISGKGLSNAIFCNKILLI